MKELLQEVIEMKENHAFLYGRSCAVFIPPIMYLRYLPKITNPEADISIHQASLSGMKAGPHVSHMVIVNPKDIDPRVLKELVMVPATLGGKKPIMEYVEIE